MNHKVELAPALSLIGAALVATEIWTQLPVETRDLVCAVTCFGGPLAVVLFMALVSHGKSISR